jgi:hypothetical protein
VYVTDHAEIVYNVFAAKTVDYQPCRPLFLAVDMQQLAHATNRQVRDNARPAGQRHGLYRPGVPANQGD